MGEQVWLCLSRGLASTLPLHLANYGVESQTNSLFHILGEPASAPVIAKSADELPRTEVVGTLDAPLAPGKNIIWCAADEMAWQELRDQALNGSR